MPRKLTGIRRYGNRWRVFVRVDGQLYAKQFPIETAVETMQAWRATQVRTFGRGTKEDRALREYATVCDARRLPRSEKTWCYIYIVRSGETVKIGRSLDPRQRIRDLQTTHAGDLEVLVTVAAHVALEAAIHARFAGLRTRHNGEWFRLDPELIAFIRALQQGANPVALLFEDPRVILSWTLHPPPPENTAGEPQEAKTWPVN